MEVKPGCGTAADCRHCQNEIRCGAKAWANDAEPPPGKSQLRDVKGIIGDLVGLE